MDFDPDQRKLSHLLACKTPQLEAETVAGGADDNPTTLAVRDFCLGPKTFCFITGGAGSGKTIAAVEALLSAKMYWDGGKSWSYSPSEARFIHADELARLSYFDAEAQKKLWRMERVPWLAIDDIGSEFVADTWRANFYTLMNARSSSKRKTIITSNLTPDEFKTRYDERIISRIAGSGVIVSSGKIDLRRKVA